MDYKGKVQDIVLTFEELAKHFADVRKNMVQCYDYVFGEQIDSTVKAELTKRNRPALVHNLLLPIVLWVSGTLSNDRTRMKATPLGEGDEEKAGLKTRVVGDYMIGDDGYQAIARAAVDAAICRVGYVKQYMDFRNNPEGEWKVEEDDPFTIMYDIEAKTWKNIRYYSKSLWMTAEEMLKLYGEYLSDEQKAVIRKRAQDIEGRVQSSTKPRAWYERARDGFFEFIGVKQKNMYTPNSYLDTFVDAQSGLYRVIEWHDCRRVTKKWVYSPWTQEMEEVKSEEEFNSQLSMVNGQQETPPLIPPQGGNSYEEYMNGLREKYPNAIFDEVELPDVWYITAAVPGLMPDEVIFEEPYKVQGAGPMHKQIRCYDFHPDKLKITSIVGSVIGNQDSFNQRRMTMLEYIMDAVNPRIRYPKGSLDKDQFPVWEENKRGGLFEFTQTNGGGPSRDVPLITPDWLQKYGEGELELMEKTTGINPNLMGQQQTANENGVVVGQRVRQGMIMTAYFFGQVQNTMREVFQYCDRGASKYLTQPRVIRLLTPEGDNEWVKINYPTVNGMMNDIRSGEYDYKPDMTQMGSTARQMKFYETLDFIKILPQELVDWTKLFELWDSPVARDMKMFAAQVMGKTMEQQQAQAAAQQQAAQLAAIEKVRNIALPSGVEK